MAEKLVCDRCGITYTDKGSIEIAKSKAAMWRYILRRDGIIARGLAPCPIPGCKGELILKQE